MSVATTRPAAVERYFVPPTFPLEVFTQEKEKTNIFKDLLPDGMNVSTTHRGGGVYRESEVWLSFRFAWTVPWSLKLTGKLYDLPSIH